MNRQTVINSAVGGAIGYTSSILWQAGQPGLGIVVFAAWIIGMVNSLIPRDA